MHTKFQNDHEIETNIRKTLITQVNLFISLIGKITQWSFLSMEICNTRFFFLLLLEMWFALSLNEREKKTTVITTTKSKIKSIKLISISINILWPSIEYLIIINHVAFMLSPFFSSFNLYIWFVYLWLCFAVALVNQNSSKIYHKFW